MPAINTSNALGAKVLFAAQPGSTGLPYADDAGAISISANGGATIGTQSGKLVFQTDPSGSKFFSTTSSPVFADGFTIAAVWALVSNPGQDTAIASITLDDSNYWFLGVQQTFGIQLLSRAGGTAHGVVFGSLGAFGTYYTSAAVFQSTTARRLYHEGAMSSDNTSSVAPSGAGRKIGIGAVARTTPSSLGAYYIRNLVIFNGALTLAELDSWRADPDQIYVAASSLSGAVDLDPVAPAGTLADGGSSGLSGNVSLDPVAPAGTLADGGASGLSGGVTLDAVAPAGTLGVQPGVVTTAPFKNKFTGALMPSVTIPKVAVVRVSDMATVLTLADVVTNGSAVMQLTNAALVPGQAYLVITCNSDGSAYGAEACVAA